MGWADFVGPGIMVALLSTLATVVVALIGRRQAAETTLPEHFTRELERMSSRQEVMQKRIDRIERRAILLSDHVDVLERWINEGREPPPPPRPDLGGDP